MKEVISKFIIVDYGAKFQFTHHLPIIEAYCNIIRNNGFEVDTFLTSNADRVAFDSLPGNKKYFLTGTVYKPSYMENFILASLIGLFNYLLKNKQGWSFLKKFLKVCFSFRAKRALINEIKYTAGKIVVIFPTAEPVTIQLAKSLLSNSLGKNFRFKFRVVGGENRGFLASKNELENLAELVCHYPSQIQVGIETDRYREFLVSKGFPKQNLIWSPWPPIIKGKIMKSINSKTIIIGFLGNAKVRKGFNEIPTILKNYSSINPDFKAIIQPAIFPWKGYTSVLNELSSLSSKLIFTDKNLDLDQLVKLVASCDLLIWPYNSNSYSINASGLLYHASDYDIPVITLKGVGFETEVIKYQLGFVVDTIADIGPKINLIINSSFNCEKYRSARIKASEKFIFQY